MIVLVAFGVTTARAYVGYAIPISWNKTVWQSVLLFFIMGAGKAVGGYLSDKIGAKKTGVLSTIICIITYFCMSVVCALNRSVHPSVCICSGG